MRNFIPLYILNAAAWVVFIIAFVKDRSRYRNCFFLAFALLFTVPTICSAFGENINAAIMCFVWICIIALLIVPFFLVHNGIIMIKREGRSLANLLSLCLGIAIGIGEISTFLFIIGRSTVWSDSRTGNIMQDMTLLGMLISVTVVYGSVAFLVFMIYSVFLMIIPRKRDFDYVIIHGAGLLDGGRVSKLLADRIDKAIDLYRKDPTPPILIPSGGKGDDEAVSEAEAMAGYLRDKGIPDDKIILEDKSATTYENLVNSKAIIDSMEGRKYTALVTSNYHVYRALRYCRKIGLRCTGVGSHVAFYYWPSALIREFIAVHSERKHAITFILGWVISIIAALYLF